MTPRLLLSTGGGLFPTHRASPLWWDDVFRRFSGPLPTQIGHVHCPASHASSSLPLAANSYKRLLARYQKPPHSRGEAGVSMREKKAGGSAGTGRPSARSRQSVLIRAESNKQTYSFSAKE